MTYNKRTFGTVAIVMVAASMLAGCTSGSPAAGSTTGEVRIADITAVSGQFGAFGEALKKGVDLAAEQVNAEGGVNGKTLVLSGADDGGDKAEAIAQFRRFASDKNVLAIIGPNLSSNALATTPLANNSKVTMVVSGALAPWSTDFGQWVFRVPPVSGDSIKIITEQAAREFDFHKVAIVSASDVDQSVAAAKDYKTHAKANGYDVVAELSFRTGDSDYSAMLTSIKNSGAEAVFISAVAVNAGPIVNQAKSLGLQVQWIGDGGLLNPQFLELGGQGAEGAITATTYFPGAEGPEQRTFTEKYRKKYGTDPSQNSAFGYDSVMMLVSAMKHVDGELTRDALRQALSGITFSGVTGTFSFPNGSGDSIRASQTIVQVVHGEFREVKSK